MVTVTLNPAIDHSVAIPEFRANTVNRVTGEQRTAAGKGINVASFLADYGIPSVVTGFLGRINAGPFEAHFNARKLDDRFVRVDGENRVNLKILNHAENEVTDINFPGLTPTPDDLAKLESGLDTMAEDHEWFALSGSLPQGFPAGIYRSLVARLRSRRRHVLLDTGGEALREAVVAQPTAIKPNVREIEEALGRPLRTEAELLAAGHELVKTGIGCVIISRGAAGALFVDNHDALSARHPGPVTIHTTVGAGDALVAGYLAAQFERLDSEGTARLAIAFSIAALQRNDLAFALGPDLRKLAKGVEVRAAKG
jgi:1-phosphofructokinase family hexose kinase